MPKVSLKGQQMPDSPIRKLVPFEEIAIEKGNKVYHLNIGQPDIKTPEVALKAVKEADLSVLEYVPSPGIKSYRTKLSKYYTDRNLPVNFEDIIITIGGSEALMFVVGSSMDVGDEIIVQEPYYSNYNSIAVATGVKIVAVPSSIDTDFALPSISEFEKLITPKTKAILICNPSNPTGYLYSKEEILQIVDLAKKHDLFIISDEVYREFIYDEGKEHVSIMSIPGIEEYAIMIDSASKRYSMCGARIGWVVSKNKKFMGAILKFAQARLSAPIFEQIAAEAALETPKEYFEEVIKEYKERRDTFIGELRKIDGVEVGMPKGAFYCIAKLPVKSSDDFARWLLESYDNNGETVMIAPAGGFYGTAGEGLDQVRLAYVLNKKDLIRSVEILKDALKVYNEKFG